MKKTFCLFLISILFSAAIVINTRLSACAQSAISTPNKIIAIVYDNSSSMTFVKNEDANTNTYTYITRWVEADYAVRALAACMDAGDEIWIYPLMSGEEKEIPYTIKEIPYTIKEIEKISTNFYGNTLYGNVETAKTALEADNRGAEKWLIILSDGEFTDSEFKNSKIPYADLLKKKLGETLANTNTDIKMLYVPIGDGAAKLNGTLPANLEQIESEDGILGQVLECMNAIYHRHVLETVGAENQNARIIIDAPLSELFVLLQQEGKEDLYDKVQAVNQDNLKAQMEGLKEILNRDAQPVRLTNEYVFESYHGDQPTYTGSEQTPDEFASMLKTKPIVGDLLHVEWDNCNIFENNEIIYDLQLAEGESVEIYYQLDFGLEIEITQDGKKVEGNEIQEGKFEVKIYPVTKEQGNRVSADASLLQNVKLTINGNTCSFADPVEMTAVYGSDVNISVAAEDEALEQPVTKEVQLSVKENIYPIQISTEVPDFFDYDLMNMDCINNRTASGIKLQFSESNAGASIPLRETTKQQLKVEYSVSYRGLKNKEESQIAMLEMDGTGDGARTIYPYLIEPDDYNIYREVYCTVTAYREDAREQSEQTIKINLKLQAEAAQVSAELLQDEPYTLADIITGKAQVGIYCNGESIPEAERKNVDFFKLEEDASYGAFSKKWSWKDSVHWFFCGDEIVPVHKEVVYTRRGVKCVAALEGEMMYQPVALWIRTIVAIILFIIAAIIVYVLVCTLEGCYFVWDFKASIWLVEPALQSEEGETLKEERKIRLPILKRKKKLKLSAGEDRQAADFPDMEIEKVKGKKAFQVVNGDQFSGLDYKIDGGTIKSGTIVQYADCIKIVTTEGQNYELRFQKNK